jgi:hypothetical protein
LIPITRAIGGYIIDFDAGNALGLTDDQRFMRMIDQNATANSVPTGVKGIPIYKLANYDDMSIYIIPTICGRV